MLTFIFPYIRCFLEMIKAFFMIFFCEVILVETIYRFSTKAITDFCNTVPPQPWQICHHLEVFP